jgi:hypothetical protein
MTLTTNDIKKETGEYVFRRKQEKPSTPIRRVQQLMRTRTLCVLL